MNKVKIRSVKTGLEQTVSPETFASMKSMNGEHAFKVLKANATPPEALVEAPVKVKKAPEPKETI